MINIWHEDSQISATTSFWEFLYKSKVSPKLINVSVKGFGGNNKLADYLKNCVFNTNDTYIILVDMVLDNAKALKYYVDIQKMVNNYKNVYLADLLCFEYMMLRFKYFEAWTEPMKAVRGYQDARKIRNKFIKCIDSGTPWTNEKDIVNYVVKYKGINTSVPGWQSELIYVSSENLATLLLSMMTNGGKTDFGVSKASLGQCWTCNCCVKYINNKIGNSKCRIHKYKKDALEKANNLWNGTLAKQIVNNAV